MLRVNQLLSKIRKCLRRRFKQRPRRRSQLRVIEAENDRTAQRRANFSDRLPESTTFTVATEKNANSADLLPESVAFPVATEENANFSDLLPESATSTVSVHISDETFTMAINTEKLNLILQNFVTETNDVQGSALVTSDGLPLASTLPGTMDEERISAMAAAMLGMGERVGRELSRGTIERLYVEGTQGYVILTDCGSDAVLLIIASQTAKQGVLMLEIKRAIEQIKFALM